MSFAIILKRADRTEYFAGYHQVRGMQLPDTTEYKSRAKTWKTPRGASRTLRRLSDVYRDYLMPAYDPAELGITNCNDVDRLLQRYQRSGV